MVLKCKEQVSAQRLLTGSGNTGVHLFVVCTGMFLVCGVEESWDNKKDENEIQITFIWLERVHLVNYTQALCQKLKSTSWNSWCNWYQEIAFGHFCSYYKNNEEMCFGLSDHCRSLPAGSILFCSIHSGAWGSKYMSAVWPFSIFWNPVTNQVRKAELCSCFIPYLNIL